VGIPLGILLGMECVWRLVNPHGLTDMSILWSFLTIREIKWKRGKFFKFILTVIVSSSPF